MIEIDPETETYTADYGCGAPINLNRAYSVLKAMAGEIESGKLLKDPDMNISTEDDDGFLDTDDN